MRFSTFFFLMFVYIGLNSAIQFTNWTSSHPKTTVFESNFYIKVFKHPVIALNPLIKGMQMSQKWKDECMNNSS